jgi:hypothetical protein
VRWLVRNETALRKTSPPSLPPSLPPYLELGQPLLLDEGVLVTQLLLPLLLGLQAPDIHLLISLRGPGLGELKRGGREGGRGERGKVRK